MKDSLHNYMRPSMVHMMMFPECLQGAGPIIETLTILATDPFFEVLEIGPINDPTTLNNCVSLLSQAMVDTLFVGQACTYFHDLDLGNENAALRQKAIEAMKAGIDQAVLLGATHCGVASGHIEPNTNIKLAKELLVESLVELCSYAAPHGITMSIENFDSIPFVKDCLIGSARDTVALSEQVRSKTDNFGIITDLSHLPLLKEHPKETVNIVKDHLAYVQIGNCSLNPNSSYYGDIHPYFGAPMTNVSVDMLAEFLRALLEIGYLSETNRGIVSFEVKPLQGQSSQAQIAGSIRALNKAWQMV